MRQPRSYVIRVYRQGFRMLSGIVEDASTGRSRSFRDLQELAALLRAPIGAHASSRRTPKLNNPEEDVS